MIVTILISGNENNTAISLKKRCREQEYSHHSDGMRMATEELYTNQ